jgi:hypothetical protein
MAIDSIEYNELGALSQSRLGTSCFVDDSRYSNFSIVSAKEKRRRTEQALASVNADWELNPKLANDCAYLQDRLYALQSKIESERKKNPSKTISERWINPLLDWEVKYKEAIQKNRCVEQVAKSEAEAQKKETLDILTKTTSDAPTETNDNKTKYIIYGVGGLVVVIGLVMLLRK